MKQFLKYFVFVVVFANALLLVSCNSDDDDVELSNFFIYDRQTIKTPLAYSDLTVDSEIYSEIRLLDKHLTYKIVKNGGNVTGSVLLIHDIPSNKNGILLEGTYELVKDDATLMIGGILIQKVM